MATTHPMKKPTASEEWNFLIIMVPPTLRAHNIRPDHAAANPSGSLRDPSTNTPKIANKRVIPRIEYLWLSCFVEIIIIIVRDEKFRHPQGFGDSQSTTPCSYHHPAINFREDPPQRDSAKYAVY